MDHVQEGPSPARKKITKDGGGDQRGPPEKIILNMKATLGYLGGVSSQVHFDPTSLRTG